MWIRHEADESCISIWHHSIIAPVEAYDRHCKAAQKAQRCPIKYLCASNRPIHQTHQETLEGIQDKAHMQVLQVCCNYRVCANIFRYVAIIEFAQTSLDTSAAVFFIEVRLPVVGAHLTCS